MEAMQNAAPAAAADFVPGEIFARLNGPMEKKGAAVGVCAMMAASYVAVLYLPAIFLRSPKSIREHMLRRFACAAVASALAPMLCYALLPVRFSFCFMVQMASDWTPNSDQTCF